MAKVDAATVIDNELIARHKLKRLILKSSQSNLQEQKTVFLSRNLLRTRDVTHKDLYIKPEASDILKFGIVCNLIKNPRRVKTRIGINRQKFNIRYIVTHSRNTFSLSEKKNWSASKKKFLCLSPKTNNSIKPKTNSTIYWPYKALRIKNGGLLNIKRQSLQMAKSILKQNKFLQPINTTPSSIIINKKQPWKASLIRNFANNICSTQFREKCVESKKVFSIKKLKESFGVWGLNLLNKQTRSTTKDHFLIFANLKSSVKY